MQLGALQFGPSSLLDRSLPPTLSGALGIVIIPDAETTSQAYKIAASLMPDGAEYVLKSPYLPHLTLYHGKLKDLPLAVGDEVLRDINRAIAGTPMEFSEVISFGGSLLYWNLRDRGSDEIRSAHIKSLEIVEYRDVAAVATSIKDENLSLTPRQLENCERYGHPLVRDDFLPHITLGFERDQADSLVRQFQNKVESAPGFEIQNGEVVKSWTGKIDRVELVRIGTIGTIQPL